MPLPQKTCLDCNTAVWTLSISWWSCECADALLELKSVVELLQETELEIFMMLQERLMMKSNKKTKPLPPALSVLAFEVLFQSFLFLSGQ